MSECKVCNGTGKFEIAPGEFVDCYEGCYEGCEAVTANLRPIPVILSGENDLDYMSSPEYARER